ncbi:hypothetical protein ABFX02_04G087600 [Erythranthe guttata]
MSGGFFRGTSADQDTRFSNKQAKLLKSKKFAPELDNLVDMTKVKMDVMRPWIAKRVTELIGFEDEVLLNFIDGLLEGKEVNGKEIQISLTGFMERNTGKFMKELWVLLLSAQQNVSGVPQQFLDAKEEETKQKQAETDRIAGEIQRQKEKEKQEIELEKAKMDGDRAMSRDKHIDLEPNVKHGAGVSSIQPAQGKELHMRNGRGQRSSRDSQSPDSPHDSPSLSERRRSRSTSKAPPSRSRSVSSERRLSSPRRSVSPRRRHIVRRSPSPWRRSSHLRRRSPSPSRYRVRSPRRYRSRSPMRRRSRSPVRRRSRTPLRRSRSPARRRSRTPLRRSRSPVRAIRRRSPSPIRGRSPSPLRGRSPSPRRRSPSPRRRSPSPARRRNRRSPSTPRKQSASPIRRRSSLHGRKKSKTPVLQRSPSHGSSSPSHIHRSSLSPVRRGSKSVRSPVQSSGERVRRYENYSPARRASPDERSELPVKNRKERRSVERGPIVSLRSPQRDMLDRNYLNGKGGESPPIQKSPSVSDSSRGRRHSDEQRSTSPRGSPYGRREKMSRPESPIPLRRGAGQKPSRDSYGTSPDDKNVSSREIKEYNKSSTARHKDLHDSAEIRGLTDDTRARKANLPNRLLDGVDHKEHERQELSSSTRTAGLSVKRKESYDVDGAGVKDKKIARPDDSKAGYRFPELADDRNGSLDSSSKETGEHGVKTKEKRKHKKSGRQEVESDDYSSNDSYGDKKDSKRRRKEEKKLKKEEKRRRRGERHRRRDERHAEKLKLKSGDAGSLSPDLAQDQSEDESVRRNSRANNIQETEFEQKKLEIELREKALESLRAKKGFGN